MKIPWVYRSRLRLRSPFRLESSGYVNFLRPRPLPNDDAGIVALTIRRSSYFLHNGDVNGEFLVAYSIAMDRAAFSALMKDVKKRNSLWSEAMTQYAKAQLCAQMAKTALLKARAGTP